MQSHVAPRSPAREQRHHVHRLAPLETAATLEDGRQETEPNANAQADQEAGADQDD